MAAAAIVLFPISRGRLHRYEMEKMNKAGTGGKQRGSKYEPITFSKVRIFGYRVVLSVSDPGVHIAGGRFAAGTPLTACSGGHGSSGSCSFGLS
jgi:hypothetical protein